MRNPCSAAWNGSWRREIGQFEYLRSATNKYGRPRKCADPVDKARKSVRKAIDTARQKVKKQHKGLWQHLRANIQTGWTCSYKPQPPIPWQIL